MIDLHLHTNASDGRCSPSQLVARAAEAGLTVLSVVDHDTFAALDEVRAETESAGLRAIPGIEITAVWHGHDVHVLGYHLDPARRELTAFLERQRADRVRRTRAMVDRLTTLGVRLDFATVLSPPGEAPPNVIGRPQVARALVAGGHVGSVREAFDRYLADGRPAFVPRIGATPAEVVRLIVEAGGIASLAHPGLTGRDEILPDLAAAGMQAIEVYHPEHPADTIGHYLAVAAHYGLLVTGGSDYHAEAGRDVALGRVTVPPGDFARFEAAARHLCRSRLS